MTLFKFSDRADRQVNVYRLTFAILQSHNDHVNPVILIRHSTSPINLRTYTLFYLRISKVTILKINVPNPV